MKAERITPEELARLLRAVRRGPRNAGTSEVSDHHRLCARTVERLAAALEAEWAREPEQQPLF